MNRMPPESGEGRRLPTVLDASAYKAYDVHREVTAATRLLRTVYPGAATIVFVPSYRPDKGRVTFVSLHDDQKVGLLDGRGLSGLLNMPSSFQPGRAANDRAVVAEAVFRLQAAVSSWRKAKVLRAPAGAAWQIWQGRPVRDATGGWAPTPVQLILPPEDEAPLDPLLSSAAAIATSA